LLALRRHGLQRIHDRGERRNELLAVSCGQGIKDALINAMARQSG